MATVTRTNGRINGHSIPKKFRRVRPDGPHDVGTADVTNPRIEHLLDLNHRLQATLAGLEEATEVQRQRRREHEDVFNEVKAVLASTNDRKLEPAPTTEPPAEEYDPRLDQVLRAEVQYELDRAASAYSWAVENLERLNWSVWSSDEPKAREHLELAQFAKRQAISVQRNLVDAVLKGAAILGITARDFTVDEPFGMVTDRWIIVLTPYVSDDGEKFTDPKDLDVTVARHETFGILTTLKADHEHAA